ncbi:MAG: hypothetical protein L5655_06710 [Thermosediminibacteraceae bacterium]|nr:hypothetical protein [Thermosediminibacteraceae bacterium]
METKNNKKWIYKIALGGAIIAIIYNIISGQYLFALCFLLTVPILIKNIKGTKN